jgi:hypothetical protein
MTLDLSITVLHRAFRVVVANDGNTTVYERVKGRWIDRTNDERDQLVTTVANAAWKGELAIGKLLFEEGLAQTNGGGWVNWRKEDQ